MVAKNGSRLIQGIILKTKNETKKMEKNWCWNMSEENKQRTEQYGKHTKKKYLQMRKK